MSDLFWSATASFVILAALYFIGTLVVPVLFWRLPAFKEIKSTQAAITTEVLDVAFRDEAWKFVQQSRETSRVSVFVHTRTSEDWINVQIEESTNILTAMCALQAIGLLIALFNNEEEADGFHLLIHAPITEMIFIFVMIYLLHKMGKHWVRTKSNFRRDAW